MTTKKTTPATEIVEQKSTDIVAQSKEVIKTDAEIDSYIATRQAFIQKVNAICVEGKDFYIIQGKKSLAKGGAEKIASIFKWTAKFDKDTESLEMLGGAPGLVAFKCTLMNGQFVGEGRGAAMLARNNGDPNKTLKMAEKSAFIDAVLRSSGLSDFFTQDLENMPQEEISRPISQNNAPQYTNDGNLVEKTQGIQPSVKQKAFIQQLCKQKKITQAQVIEMAKGKNPSQLIEFLLAYQTPEVQPELPTIQQDESKVIDENGNEIVIPF